MFWLGHLTRYIRFVSQLVVHQNFFHFVSEIQRPFVWKSVKVRDLMNYLYQGFPIDYQVILLFVFGKIQILGTTLVTWDWFCGLAVISWSILDLI